MQLAVEVDEARPARVRAASQHGALAGRRTLAGCGNPLGIYPETSD
jgi:hypothetical protein